MSHKALGGITIRLGMGSIFLFFLIYLFFIIFFMRKSPKIKISKSPLFVLINVFFIFFILGIIIGFVKGNNLKYLLLDTFPLLEMFIVYYIVKLSQVNEDNFDFGKIIKWFVSYLFLMSITGLASYLILSFFRPVHFGALRALISGTTVNRLMDFIIPLFLPVMVIFYSYTKYKKLIILLTIINIIVVLLTFYRTIYVAVFSGILYMIIANWRKLFHSIKAFLVITVLVAIVMIPLQKSRYFKYGSLNIFPLVVNRIISIYAPEKEIDVSASARISHNKEMFFSGLNNFPDIAGMGGEYENSMGQSVPLNFTSNYILQIISLLGIPAGLLFIWIYLKVFIKSHKYAKKAVDMNSKIFFNACSSILIVLLVILNIFPYMNYFPFLYLFGWICGIVDNYSVFLRQKEKLAFCP